MTDQNFDAMRQAMVVSQLRTNEVNDPRVVDAMGTIARERFVPADRAAVAYIDRPVPLGSGRALNLPMVTGRLIVAAEPTARDRALVIGAGTGYTAAVLSRLVDTVVALEEDQALVAQARTTLADCRNVTVVEGPLVSGHADGAPYDIILIDGAVERLPAEIVAQLAEGGRLTAGIIEDGVSRLVLGRRTGAGFGSRAFADADAVSLPGFAPPPSFVF